MPAPGRRSQHRLAYICWHDVEGRRRHRPHALLPRRITALKPTAGTSQPGCERTGIRAGAADAGRHPPRPHCCDGQTPARLPATRLRRRWMTARKRKRRARIPTRSSPATGIKTCPCHVCGSARGWGPAEFHPAGNTQTPSSPGRCRAGALRQSPTSGMQRTVRARRHAALMRQEVHQVLEPGGRRSARNP